MDSTLFNKYCDDLLTYLSENPKGNNIGGTGHFRNTYKGGGDVFEHLRIPDDYIDNVLVHVTSEFKFVTTVPFPEGKTALEGERRVSLSSFAITFDGQRFISSTSFTKEAERELLLHEIDKKTLKKTDQDLLIGEFMLKTKWWPLALSIISFGWGVWTFIDGRSENRTQRLQIENLQLKLHETKSEIYKRMDSICQLKYTSDTFKKK